MNLERNVTSTFKEAQKIWAQANQAVDQTLEHALEYYERMLRLFKTFKDEKAPSSAHSQPENISFDSSADQTQNATPDPSLGGQQNPTGDAPGALPETRYWGEVAKIGLGCASTVFFAYKAYHAIDKLRKKEEEEQEKKYPSWLPALGYTVAAVCSAAYTVFKLQ